MQLIISMFSRLGLAVGVSLSNIAVLGIFYARSSSKPSMGGALNGLLVSCAVLIAMSLIVLRW